MLASSSPGVVLAWFDPMLSRHGYFGGVQWTVLVFLLGCSINLLVEYAWPDQLFCIT